MEDLVRADHASLFKIGQTKVASVASLSCANLADFIWGLIHEETSDQMVNNIFVLAANFECLKFKRIKKSELSFNFESSKQNLFKIDGSIIATNTLKKKLDQLKVKKENHDWVFKMLDNDKTRGMTKTKAELSILCFVILINALQDRKDFSKIRRLMKKVTKSELLKTIKLSDDFLERLREPLRKHKNRPAFGTCIIETITAFNGKELSKQLSKKCSKRHELVVLLKHLFYLQTSEIVMFIDKVHCYLGGKRFRISMDLLFDDETKSEITKWFPMFWAIVYEKNPREKRVALAYKSLIADQSEPFSKLSDHKRTVSFFFGLFSSPLQMLKEVRDHCTVELESRYYALGGLYKAHFFLTLVEDHLKLARAQKLNVTDDYLRKWLDVFNDRLYDEAGEAVSSSEIFADGLRQIKADTISPNCCRSQLFTVIEIMTKLDECLRESDAQKRKKLIDRLPSVSRFHEESPGSEGAETNDLPVVHEKTPNTDLGNVLKQSSSQNTPLNANLNSPRVVVKQKSDFEQENQMEVD